MSKTVGPRMTVQLHYDECAEKMPTEDILYWIIEESMSEAVCEIHRRMMDTFGLRERDFTIVAYATEGM